MRRSRFFAFSICLVILIAAAVPRLAQAQGPRQMVRERIDESKMVALGGNVHPAATRASNDRGRVNDEERFEHLLVLLKRDPDTEAALKEHIEALHNPASPEFHHWLSAEEIGARFGAHPEDSEAVQQWLRSHGFTVNQQYKNGLVLDVSGNARQIREAFRTEMHNLVLPNGDRHVANMSEPQIPAALEPVIAGVSRLHDFRPQPRLHHTKTRQISFDSQSGRWKSDRKATRFSVPIGGFTFNVVAPFDFATIYNLKPLWQAGFTGKGVSIALIEDTDLANPEDWASFRKNFGMTGFTHGNFKQVFPGCKDPGANSDEDEAALDVEWSSAAAPDASVELVACGNTKTTSGIDAPSSAFWRPPRPTSSRSATAAAKLSPDNREICSPTPRPNSPPLRASPTSSRRATPARTNAPPSSPPTFPLAASTAAITPPPRSPWTSAARTSWPNSIPT